MLCEQRSARHRPVGARRGGWTDAQFAEKRLPTVSDLNAAAPDTPVMCCTWPVSDP